MPPEKPAVVEDTKNKPTPVSEPVVVFAKWCKGCRVCVEFCPTQALAMGPDDHPVLVDAARCTLCGMCEIRCPDFAITVPGRKRPKRPE